MIPMVLDTEPQPIAKDTWLIPTIAAEGSGAYFAAHSLLIRGEQPVIVDTGCAMVRDSWSRQVFSLVDPADVRWVFLSHDDHDHLGNLEFVLDQCPNATLVCNFLSVARLFGSLDLPIDRMRWVDPGDQFAIGDRTLQIVRPPMFDSPATRGVYDPTTRMLWAVDSFATFFPGEVYDADEVPADMYDASFAALNGWNTPWLEWIDVSRYAAHVRATESLSLDVVASAHGPVHRGARIGEAFRRTLQLANQPAPPTPGQDVLEHMVAMLVAAVG